MTKSVKWAFLEKTQTQNLSKKPSPVSSGAKVWHISVPPKPVFNNTKYGIGRFHYHKMLY
jgi:hypothetical protein